MQAYEENSFSPKMPQSNPLSVLVPVSAIFPNITSNLQVLRNLLKDLSRTDTIFWCARLNLFVSGPPTDSSIDSPLEKQRKAVELFLTRLEIDRLNAFVQKQRTKKVRVFSRMPLLELMKYATLYSDDHSNDGATFNDPEVRRKFVQAAMIVAELWGKHTFPKSLWTDGDLEARRQNVLPSIRRSAEAALTTKDTYVYIGRGMSLFTEYLPRYYPKLNEAFRTSSGLSLEEYYNCSAAMLIHFLKSDFEAKIFDTKTFGKSTQCLETLFKYIQFESQTIDELKNKIHNQTDSATANNEYFRSLRENPILKAKDERAIIVDPIFYAEKTSVGPLFALIKEKKKDEVNRIFDAFGSAFEEYACDILKRMYPETPGPIEKRLTCKYPLRDPNGDQIVIDALLNDVTEIVLFEMKSVWIPEKEIQSEEPERYLKILHEKYASYSESSNHGKNKGMGQLARYIEIITSNDPKSRSRDFNKVELIYPVLVPYDSLVAIPVQGSVLSLKFKEFLKPDTELPSGQLRKGRCRVALPIIMTIDDLENLETSIEHFSLRDLLADYSRERPDRIHTLHHFIANSPKYSQQMFHNRNCAVKAQERIQRAAEAIFGKKLGSQN